MQTHTHTDVRPDELSLVTDGTRILDASWTVSTASENGGWDNEVRTAGNISSPATRDEAIRLLMLCRYPRPDRECAILRRPEGDPERDEHEAYFGKVEAFVDSLCLPDTNAAE